MAKERVEYSELDIDELLPDTSPGPDELTETAVKGVYCRTPLFGEQCDFEKAVIKAQAAGDQDQVSYLILSTFARDEQGLPFKQYRNVNAVRRLKTEKVLPVVDAVSDVRDAKEAADEAEGKPDGQTGDSE